MLRASNTADIFFDGVRVPGSALLGGKDKLDEKLARAREGRKTSQQAAMATFELSRPTVGAMAVGVARAAYEYALDYAKERVVFGRPIIEKQAISFLLADIATEIDAARLLVRRAAWMGATGQKFASAEGSMSKLKAGRVAVWTPNGPSRSSAATATPRVSGRADAPRRQDLRHLRGDRADPAAGHRPLDHRAPIAVTQAGWPKDRWRT